MSSSLYDFTAGTYKQMLNSTAKFMTKGREHCEANDTDPEDMVKARLREDMMPFHFQVVSSAHHSLGALKGLQSGTFSPPSFEIDMNYQGLQDLISNAIEGLNEFTPDVVNGFADGELVFKMGKREMLFDAEVFLRTFSLPNFYFHVTTTYDILRTNGVGIGKIDFLGDLSTKS